MQPRRRDAVQRAQEPLLEVPTYGSPDHLDAADPDRLFRMAFSAGGSVGQEQLGTTPDERLAGADFRGPPPLGVHARQFRGAGVGEDGLVVQVEAEPIQ